MTFPGVVTTAGFVKMDFELVGVETFDVSVFDSRQM